MKNENIINETFNDVLKSGYNLPKSRTNKVLSNLKKVFLGSVIASSLFLGITYKNHLKLKYEFEYKVRNEVSNLVNQYISDEDIRNSVFDKVDNYFIDNPNIISNNYKNSIDSLVNVLVNEVSNDLKKYSKKRVGQKADEWFEEEKNKIQNNIQDRYIEQPSNNLNNNISIDSNQNTRTNNNSENNSDNIVTRSNINNPRPTYGYNIVYADRRYNNEVLNCLKRIEEIGSIVLNKNPNWNKIVYTDKNLDKLYVYDLKSSEFIGRFFLVNKDRSKYRLNEFVSYLVDETNKNPRNHFSDPSNSSDVSWGFISGHSSTVDNKYILDGNQIITGPILKDEDFNQFYNLIKNDLSNTLIVSEDRNNKLNISNYNVEIMSLR